MEDEIFEIKNEIRTRIPEHEILISFYDDEDAEMFYDWFNSIGKNDFVNWLAVQK